MFRTKRWTVSLLVAAALLLPRPVLAAAGESDQPISVELKLRKDRLLPFEPLIGSVTVTNNSARRVQLPGTWNVSALRYEGGNESGALYVSWLGSFSGWAAPLDLDPDQEVERTFTVPTFAIDSSAILKPRTKYTIGKTVAISEARSLHPNPATVSIEPVPKGEVAAVAALTTRKLDKDNGLVRALVGAVPRDAATFTAIRRFVAEFPDSTYSIYLRRTYLQLASAHGPALAAADKAPLEEYAAHLKEHAEDLLAPLLPALEQAAARDKPPPAKPAPPPLKPADPEVAAAVGELIAAYHAAVNRGDADRCLAMLTEDFRFGPGGLSREEMREPIEEDAQENRAAGDKSRRVSAEVTEVGLAENGELEAKVRTEVTTKDGTLVVGPTHRLWRLRRVGDEWKVRTILTEEEPAER